jgi:hypothetical protein
MHALLVQSLLLLPVAGQIQIEPAAITLTGPKATQRLLVLEAKAGTVHGDRTRQAKFTSSNPAIAVVDGAGQLRAIGDGEATISATHGTASASVKVKVQKTREPSDESFTNHVIPVLTRLGCNSGACHGALAGKGGFKLSLRGYDPVADHFVMTRQVLGRRVNTQEPAKSLILLKPTLAISHGGGLKLEIGSPEFQTLADWIASGAPGPSPKDPHITRLEVFPTRVVVHPKDQLQVLVRAGYSDGHTEDVTRLARFGSTEDLVASVDDAGLVKVNGHGEAAITVLYSNLVASARIASPIETPVDEKLFTGSPKHNFIDEHVLAKLRSLQIPPSPQCRDRDLIRRAFLDCIGVLPTPNEVEKFLGEPRAKLIDALLERPEYIDYWSYRWSDLLLISSRKLSQPAMRSFYQFVRQSVADNKPWDAFARDVLTARGSTLRHGQANYFALHKDISDLTESTAVTFLGMSITCCRCHNHPLEKWTQDQYWGLANLFSQVLIKNGERGGELIVQSAPDGDVLHPRRGVPMPPTPLDGKPAPAGLDRRVYFAQWLTAPENPYFAKALVNRVWRNFLGRGLVEAEDDVRQTNPPSNPDLLDALAHDFIEHKYDVKHLIRVIMNSAAYQRSSTPLAGNKADDRYYSHYLVRRLPAEVVLDAYSAVTKVPTAFTTISLGPTGGDAKTGDYPLGTRALQLPDTQLVSLFLDAFGRPERGQTCSCERQQEASVTQALHLNNGQTLNDKLRNAKSRVAEWAAEKISDTEAIRRIFALALSRPPTAAEEERLAKLIADSARDPQATRRDVLEDVFWSVLTSREFLFNH